MAPFRSSGRGDVPPIQGALRFLSLVSCMMILTGRSLQRAGGPQTEAEPVSDSGLASDRGQGISGLMGRRGAPERDLMCSAKYVWPAMGK